ncbi:DeoR/GlpR family DNA-binding transcription regulator [Lonepinella sp. BR2271]|uniref:DeoR/GlpR family DNA-binding transcription regulator n=1 Tax=Lonepinella sp. BR2271 TaxID=3434550 RepID=UPI003F6E0C32
MDRKNVILELLEQKGSLNNQELSKLLNCSSVTIRNIVRELEKQGLLVRTHGEIHKVKNTISIAIPAGNILKDQESKLKIAEQAYQYIEERDTIILDDSSNSYYLAKVLKQHNHKYLIVITNSLVIAAELSECPSIDVFMMGGIITNNPPACTDNFACQMLKSFKATKAFIGVHGIDPNMGVTSIGNAQMQFKKLIFESSSQVYVLACGNKFGTGYVLVSAKIEEINRIITDRSINPEYLTQLENRVLIDIVD